MNSKIFITKASGTILLLAGITRNIINYLFKEPEIPVPVPNNTTNNNTIIHPQPTDDPGDDPFEHTKPEATKYSVVLNKELIDIRNKNTLEERLIEIIHSLEDDFKSMNKFRKIVQHANCNDKCAKAILGKSFIDVVTEKTAEEIISSYEKSIDVIRNSNKNYQAH